MYNRLTPVFLLSELAGKKRRHLKFLIRLEILRIQLNVSFATHLKSDDNGKAKESSTENRQGPGNKRKIKSNRSFETARDVLCRRAFVVGPNFQRADFVKLCFKVKKNRHYLK